MPVTKNQRRARHEQAETPTIGRGSPSGTEGRIGSQQFKRIAGKGLVHMVKTDIGWQEMGSSQTSTNKGDKVTSAISSILSTSEGGAGGIGGGTTNITASSPLVSSGTNISMPQYDPIGAAASGIGNEGYIAAGAVYDGGSPGTFATHFLRKDGTWADVSASLNAFVTWSWVPQSGTPFTTVADSSADSITITGGTGVEFTDTSDGATDALTISSTIPNLTLNGAGTVHANNYTDTNTWRGIDDTPVDGQTAESISSNWAYDHDADASAHHTKYTDSNATSAMGSKGDSNPYHHDKYTNSNAVSAMGTKGNSNALNHDRYSHPNHSGDVTSSGDGAQTIPNDTVTYAKMQNVSAGRKFLGRNTNSAGDTEEITMGQAVTLLATESGSSDEYLCGSGVFREVSVAVAVAGLSDTAMISLADGDLLYYQNSTSLWKNTSSISITSSTSGTLPVNRGGTGATSGYNNSNWDTAHTDRLKWDGGSTGLTASTGRTSLGLNTGNDVQFDSFGVGTAASGTTGEIRATHEVTAYYSDDRLKTKQGNIKKALEKVCSLNGFHYQPNELAGDLGYNMDEKKVGVSAQEVLKVLPEAVTNAPIDPQYHTVQYEKLVPLLIEAIKELNERKCSCGSK
tara:strand:+ start:4938 stop:6818 length:1881 start_codon:yes stop_codon:yes gene_type:complete